MYELRCDICGGNLIIQSGGNLAVCDCCGVQYSTERMREKVQEIRGSVQVEGEIAAKQTGTPSDISQWRALVQKYYDAGDFLSAEQIVKKILEASPADKEAGNQYEELQVLKYMEIKNGVLVKYTGGAATLKIPTCVSAIGEKAFENNKYLSAVITTDSIAEIGDAAFSGCTQLQTINLPQELLCIKKKTFQYCTALAEIEIPYGVEIIEESAFLGCKNLSLVVIPETVREIETLAFCECPNLAKIDIPESMLTLFYDRYNRCTIFNAFYDDEWSWNNISPWYCDYVANQEERQRQTYCQNWRAEGLCQHCGGKITGLFKMKCSRCGKPLDY